VAHGFLGREGGVSTGVYASLNTGLGSGDDPDRVRENRRRALDTVGPGATLVTLYQVHSARAVTVTEPWDDAARPQADALVTDRPGLALGVLTADCAPVLLADSRAGVIAAAHAGWKGALTGVLAATVEAMVERGARTDRIRAAIGPCIGRDSYEVDAQFRDRFLAASADTDTFFRSGKDSYHFFFNLEGYVAAQLALAGVSAVERLGRDTCALSDHYFSYRRTTHRNEQDYGRQISIIALV